MFGSDKSANSSQRKNDQSHMPLLGGDKKNDDHQCERLFVKIKSGDTTEIEIDISENETVDDLKKKLIKQLNIVGKRIRLIASGRMLEPGNKSLISDFKVNTGAFIHLVITENILNQSPNGTAPSQNSASAPSATVYRGLDQLNAGMFLSLLFCVAFKHMLFDYLLSQSVKQS
jgi:Ubiquitin family